MIKKIKIKKLIINFIILIIIILLFYYLLSYIKKIEGLTNKPKIAFCIVGQVRTNSCVSDYSQDEYMKEFWDNNIFNTELKENYDYDVFISCDKNINIEKTKSYFGNHLKNIHIINDDNTDSEYYMVPIKNKLPSLDDMFKNNEKYKNKDNYFINSISQYYKLYDSYNLLENNSNINNYKYIIRMRFDILFDYDIINILNDINNDLTSELYIFWEIFSIGKPNIMKQYFKILDNYESYDFTKQRHDMKIGITGSSNSYYSLPNNWKNATEIKMYENLYSYCNKNNLDIDTTIKRIKLKETCFVCNYEKECFEPECKKKYNNMYCYKSTDKTHY